LVLSVDPDLDEIKPSIQEDYKVIKTENEHIKISLHNSTNYELGSMLDKSLVWLWTMKNNQGYLDGIQIEMSDHRSYQFMVEGSCIKIRRLEEIETPELPSIS